MPNTKKFKKHEDVLMNALDFDADDLEANERGEFSPAQIKRLNRGWLGTRTMTGVTSAFVLAIPVMYAFLRGAATPLIGITLVILLVLVAVDRVKSWQMQRDLQAGIAQAEGRIELDMRYGQNSANYYARIDGKKFRIKKATFLAFKNGDPYRLYYTPYSNMILSAAWLREDSPFIEGKARPITRLEETPAADPADDARRIITDDGELREDAR